MKIKNSPVIFILVIGFLFSFLFYNRAFAHKVSIFAYSEGSIIYTESYFPDGSPVINGEIQVYDSNNKLILNGKTDNKGIYNFKAPKIDDLKIVLLASMGHRAEFVLKKEEIATADTEDGNVNNVSISKSQIGGISVQNKTGVNKTSENVALSTGNVTADEIRKIVSEEVAKELKPIARGIAKLEENKPGPTEIIGGIGYIIGLIGITMFFLAKKRDE